mgnify:CR=1 FL=1
MSDITRPFQIMTKAAGASCNMRCDYCYYLEKENLIMISRKKIIIKDINKLKKSKKCD